MPTGEILSDRAALLRRILETPEDDAPRLIYADILEEGGEDERAEFIRLQCKWPDQIARVEYCRGNAVGSPLIEWPDSMTSIVGHQNYDARWRRGFVSEIRLTCEEFMQPGEACNKCHPMCPGEVYINLGPDSTWETCKACNGSGRLPSLTERIFSEHPVTRVVLTDKEPTDNAGVGTYFGLPSNRADRWFWIRPMLDVRGMRWEIPNELKMPTTEFHSEDDALDALSAACVAYGRALVGLPELGAKQ